MWRLEKTGNEKLPAAQEPETSLHRLVSRGTSAENADIVKPWGLNMLSSLIPYKSTPLKGLPLQRGPQMEPTWTRWSGRGWAWDIARK